MYDDLRKEKDVREHEQEEVVLLLFNGCLTEWYIVVWNNIYIALCLSAYLLIYPIPHHHILSSST